MRNKSFYVFGVLLLAALMAVFGGVAYAQSQTPGAPAQAADNTAIPRTLTVSGSGTAYLTPDIAYINIGVHSEGANAAEVVASNNTQSQKVIDAIKKTGVDAKDIQTTNFSIYPQQQFDSQGKPTGEIKYMVDNTVFVTVRSLDKIGDLLDEAVKAGANSINGIQFDVVDRTKALSDARKAAVEDARGQAEELAQAASVTLGPVQSISTSSAQPIPLVAKGGGFGAAAESAVPVSSGQLVVTVDVSIVYEIR